MTAPDTGTGILALNTGSATLKASLFDSRRRLRVRALIDRRDGAAHLVLSSPDGGQILAADLAQGPLEQDLHTLLDALARSAPELAIGAIGHRVVHGGGDFHSAVRLSAPVIKALEALTPLAPLHQPPALTCIRAMMALRPDLPQMASFDTAFHAGHAPATRVFALPYRYAEAGVLRYGFHGLSYRSIAGQLATVDPRLARGRVIVAHLGSGCSLCALDAGRSVETSMGFSALDGLPMGTRPGALDAGVVLYMLNAEKLAPAAIESLLYRQSGLLGLSGVSADMRTLLASDVPGARLAVDHFCQRAAREIAALCPALDGLDGLVFTAGIGEHCAAVRARIAARLAWLGLRLDPARNAAAAGIARLHADDSRVSAWVIPTDEESVIAQETEALLHAAS